MSNLTVIAFDVDGCLLDPAGKAVANENIRTLLVVLSSFPNVHIRVWSGSGELYARQVTGVLGIATYVDSYSSKPATDGLVPHITIDDQDITLGTVNLVTGT